MKYKELSLQSKCKYIKNTMATGIAQKIYKPLIEINKIMQKKN